MRKYVIAFLIGSMVVLNPIVFSLLLSEAARPFGPEGAAFVKENQVWMTAVATAYSLGALYMVFALRVRPMARATAAARPPAGQPGQPVRGPGGGKKRPKGGPRTTAGKRPRTRLVRGGAARGARKHRGR